MSQTASIQRGASVRSQADEPPSQAAADSEGPISDSVGMSPPPPPKEGVRLVLWRLTGLLLTMRPHQWVKNVFVLAPVVFAREMFITELLVRSIGAFGVFCLLTGAVYTMNDLVDIDNDATHPIKRFRPIPSGRVPISWARTAAVALVLISLAGAAIGPLEFFVTALAYFALNVAYSLKLKQIAYLDVGAIAAGFVLRVLAGGFATHTDVSLYLTVCTALLALFLGLGKRRHELSTAARGMAQQQRKALGGYSRRGLRWSHRTTALLTVASYVAYTLDPETMDFFNSRHLWWTSVFVFVALWRFMVLVRSRPQSESPTQEMLRDGPFVAILFSWGVAMLSLVYNLGPN